jgi:hypothetical protein
VADQWYFSRDEKKLGPYSAVQLKELAAAGEIQLTDTIWKEGVASGCPASRVKHLFPSAPAAPVPDPPPSSAEPESQPTAKEQTSPEPAAAMEPARVFQEAEAPPSISTGPPPIKPKKKLAVAVQGVVIITQDGERVAFRKKCIKCKFEDNCRTTLPIRIGTTRATFYCPKCRKVQPVVLQGSG